MLTTGFGYGYIPVRAERQIGKESGNKGFDWYPVNYQTRQPAHKECQQELSWLNRPLYTQLWIELKGVRFRIPFTRRSVAIIPRDTH